MKKITILIVFFTHLASCSNTEDDVGCGPSILLTVKDTKQSILKNYEGEMTPNHNNLTISFFCNQDIPKNQWPSGKFLCKDDGKVTLPTLRQGQNSVHFSIYSSNKQLHFEGDINISLGECENENYEIIIQ